MKKLAVDFISSLPDEILHHILSFVPTKFGIRTSVLSKRWKHVWRKTPSISIDFYNDCWGADPSSVKKTLMSSYSAPKITSFKLSDCNGVTTSYYDSWIELAKSRNAENVSLHVNSYPKYRFQDFFLNNSSLNQLCLTYCVFDVITPRCIVSWTSLRSLSLSYCNLSDESVANILSGCPILESLTLYLCNGIHHLDLSKSLRLTRLDIDCCVCDLVLPRRPMHIVAPHIHYLRLRISDQPCTLVDVSSLTEANFKCFYIQFASDIVLDSILDTTVKMLANLENIEKLSVGAIFLQILSLAELRHLPFPQFKIKDLTVETKIVRSAIPGIVRLLQNSPRLTKITVHTTNQRAILDEEQKLKGYLKTQGLNTDHCWSEEYGVFPAEDAESSKHVALFIELLLQNTMTLETIVLRLDGYLSETEYQMLLPTVSSHNKTNIKILPYE